MNRVTPRLKWLTGTILGCCLVVLSTASIGAQPLNSQIQVAINNLINGVTLFLTEGIQSNGYINWGVARGQSGYGFRDLNGTIQFKHSGGSWTSVPASAAPINATYITQTANGTLTNEQTIASVGTALLRGTTTTGVIVAYGGTTCTNSFVRALSVVGAATCASVDLAADVTGTLPAANGGTGHASYLQGDLLYADDVASLSTLAKDATATRYLSNTGANNNPAWAQIDLTNGVTGTLPVTRGGTGLAVGTDGGVLAFTGTTTLTSSGLLTQYALMTGGGAGATPGVLSSLGTTTTILHGNAAGQPTWSAVVLTADVSGILPGANGGTANGFMAFSGPTTTLKTFALPDASATILTSAAAVTVAQGGTGLASYTTGDLIYAAGATTLAPLTIGASGAQLRSNGSAPIWSTTIWPNAATTGDLLYASGANTYANRAAVAVGQVLISAGTSTAPVWSASPTIAWLNWGTGTTLASAATVTPTTTVAHITGTVPIDTITVPAACTTTCTIVFIPDGIYTLTTAGNVAIASTAVVSRAMALTWDGTKWYPSYL